MAAGPDLPREPVTAQLWTVSLHVPTVAARLAVVDLEVRPLEVGPGFWMGQGMEVGSVRLPNPVAKGILEGLGFIRGDRADEWAAIHCQLPDAWDTSLRSPGHDGLAGVDWRLWAANGPCPPMVMWPRKSGPGPS